MISVGIDVSKGTGIVWNSRLSCTCGDNPADNVKLSASHYQRFDMDYSAFLQFF